jgi:hypothetical protein
MGLRSELQTPFYPLNDSYSTATIEDVWGRSGVGNLFRPGVLTGKSPEFILYNKGEGAYNTDLNNFAPSLGFAWTLGGSTGLLGSLLGRDPGDSVLRAGYALGYNRQGMTDFIGAIDDNPGIALNVDRNHTRGNLGTPGSILFRNRGDLGPPSFPSTRVYPMTDEIDGDVRIFDPNLQVPYAQTFTGGWQRKLTRDMVVEARYVGTRSHQRGSNTTSTKSTSSRTDSSMSSVSRNRICRPIISLEARALVRSHTFGAGTGTSPLPIYLVLQRRSGFWLASKLGTRHPSSGPARSSILSRRSTHSRSPQPTPWTQTPVVEPTR